MTEQDKEKLFKILKEAQAKGKAIRKVDDSNVNEMLLESLRFDEYYNVHENDIILADKILKESKTKEEAIKKMKKAKVSQAFINFFSAFENKGFEVTVNGFVEYNITNDELMLALKVLKESFTIEGIVVEEIIKKLKEAGFNELFVRAVKVYKHFMYINDTNFSEDEREQLYIMLMESNTVEQAFKKMEDARYSKIFINKLREIERFDLFDFSKISERQMAGFVLACNALSTMFNVSEV